MRRLLRLPFSVSAFALMVAIFFVGIARHQFARTHELFHRELLASVERESSNVNALMAAHIQHVFERTIGAMVYLRDREGAEILMRSGVHDALDAEIRALARGSSIIKVKLFSLDGYTVFSTTRADLGQRKYSEAFDHARQGRSSPIVERRKVFSAIDGERRDIDVISSYMPMRWLGHDDIAAVLEFYVDVTSSVAQAHIAERQQALQIGLSLGALYLVVIALVAAAARLAVAARRRSEQHDAERRATDAQFHEGIESMVDAFVMFGADGRLARWNSRFVEMFPHLAGAIHPGLPIRELLRLHADSPLFGIREADRDSWVENAIRVTFDRPTLAAQSALTDGRTLSGSITRTPSGAVIHVIRDVTAATLATSELERSEARFRDGIDSIGEGFVLLDADARVVVWNAAFERLFPGLDGALNVGMPFVDVARDGIESRCNQTSSGGTVIVYRDITAERRAYQALEASEKRFRDFAETTADWFWELDAAYRFKFLSDSSFAITGQRREQLYGVRPQDFRPEGVNDDQWQEHLATLEACRPFRDFRFRTIDPDGARRHVSVSAQPFFAPDGRFLGYRGVGKDITSLVESEAALAAAKAAAEHNEAMFRDGIDSMIDAFALLDSERRLQHWNQRYEAMFPHLRGRLARGVTLREVFEAHAESAMYAIPPDARAAWVDRCLAEAELADRNGFKRQFADGREVWAAVTHTRGSGLIYVIRDITAESTAQRRLAESEQRFREGIDSMVDAFVMYDPEFRVLHWNQRYEEFYPHLRGHLVPNATHRDIVTLHAHSPLYAIPPDERERWIEQALEDLVATGAGPLRRLADGRVLRGLKSRTQTGATIVVIQDFTNEAAAAEALTAAKTRAEKSEAMFRDGMDSMVDGFIMFDAENRVAKWNSRYVALFPHVADRIRAGLPARELMEMHAASPLYAIPEPERARWIDEALSYKPGEQTDFKRILSDGRVLRVTGTMTAGGGEIYVIADITAETSVQDALAESEAKFRDFAEIASDWFWETDAQDRFTYVSAGIGRVGLTSSDVVGRRREELASHDEEAGRDIDAIRVAMADRASFRNFEYRVRIPNGPDRMLSISGRPVFTADGDFVGYRGTGRDVSELHASRARLEAALADLRTSRDEARRLALVAQHTDSAVIITDAAGAVEWVNPGFTRISGYSLDEIRGRVPGHVLRSPKTDAETVTRIRNALTRGEGFHAELVNRTKDGRDYWLEIDCAPVLGDDGAVEHFIAIEADITGRKEQERRIAEALERERTAAAQQKRFVAVAAHEFRTPLTIIDGAAQRMIRNAERVAPDDLRERAQKIRGAVARMSQLVDTTLNSARLDEGQIDINFSKVDIVGLVATVCRRQESISAGFAFSVTSNVASFAIEADARLLDQVFTNLIANAVKYSGSGRRVDIALACAAATARVSVRDYGIGVPSEEIPNLFTRFFRASTARGLPGTGIGLNLVKELVTLHHGDVTVESEVGRGSTFIVTLPVESDRTRATARGPVAA